MRNALRDIQNASVAQTKAVVGVSAALRTDETNSEELRNFAASLAFQARETVRLAWEIYNAATALQSSPAP